MQRRTFALLAAAAGLLPACGQAGGNAAARSGQKTAVIELEKGGSITLQLFPEAAAQTVQNFEKKANSGFYNGLIFHRVEAWVVQGGDPKGNGTGGGTMPSELNDRPFTVGSVGIARGRDIKINNDSQFFICTQVAEWLNKQYTNFGQVTAGMETVQAIRVGDKIKKITVTG
jgi:cyclophilin family peptidyl-prolyl cis-trans isomerase